MSIRTVSPREVGLMNQTDLTNSGLTYADVGIVVQPAGQPAPVGLSVDAIDVQHGRFQHFLPDAAEAADGTLFPTSALRAFEASEIAAGRPPIFATALYQGVHRPVIAAQTYGKPLCGVNGLAAQAVNVADPRFIDFWVNKYVLPIAYKNVAGRPNTWIECDNGIYEWAFYGVCDSNGDFTPMGSGPSSWDNVSPSSVIPPFPVDANSYKAMIYTFFSVLKMDYPAISVMVNFDGVSPYTDFPMLYANVPGLMAENFMPQSTSYGRSKIFEFATNYWTFGQMGRVGLIRAEGISLPDADPALASLRTALVMYYLVRGANFFWDPTVAGLDRAYPRALYASIREALGLPYGPMNVVPVQGAVNDGYCLLWRMAEHGLVYYNQTGVSQTITLPSGISYFDRDGNSVSQIALPDLTGDYVTTPAGTLQTRLL